MNTFHESLTICMQFHIIHTWNKKNIRCCASGNTRIVRYARLRLSQGKVSLRPLNAWLLRNGRGYNAKERKASMLLSKKIRLEVSEQDAATLGVMQAKCRAPYNH